MSSGAFRCGHPKTPENTQTVGVANGVRCRICRRKTARESWARNYTPVQRAPAKPKTYDPEYYRINRLPEMLANARRKVAALENEARRYGFTDLLENTECRR